MDRTRRIRLLWGGIPWQGNYHSLHCSLSVYRESSCGNLLRTYLSGSFGHSCQRKIISCEILCTLDIWITHTQFLPFKTKYCQLVFSKVCIYSKIASYKQTQQTIASSQWWVTSVTPLNQNSLNFFLWFLCLSERSLIFWGLVDSATPAMSPRSQRSSEALLQSGHQGCGDACPAPFPLRRFLLCLGIIHLETSQALLITVDHRWAWLSMVDHGWQVNQLIGWHHLSRKSERTWMGFLDIILFHQFDTQALLIVWERCSCCVARMLKFTTSWRKSLAPSIAFRRNWQLSSLLNCSCIMSLIVRRVCISWYSRLLVPAISVSLQDVQAFRDSSNSLARNQRPKLTSCNDHHIHTHAHTRTRLHHLIERDLPVPEHRNQVYILWDALAEKKVNRTLPGPINSSIWLNEVGIGRQPDFAVQHSSSV